MSRVFLVSGSYGKSLVFSRVVVVLRQISRVFRGPALLAAPGAVLGPLGSYGKSLAFSRVLVVLR